MPEANRVSSLFMPALPLKPGPDHHMADQESPPYNHYVRLADYVFGNSWPGDALGCDTQHA